MASKYINKQQLRKAWQMQKYNILLVDDSPNILRALQRTLREDNYLLTECNSAEKAVLLCEKQSFDLVICDQNMPGISGIELLQFLKIKSPEMIRILLTGYSDIEVTKIAVNKCAIYKYFDKPWDDFELKLAVRYALTHKIKEDPEANESNLQL
jgi:response regulator RpfG family c-di-GMP phosphodiesterase